MVQTAMLASTYYVKMTFAAHWVLRFTRCHHTFRNYASTF